MHAKRTITAMPKANLMGSIYESLIQAASSWLPLGPIMQSDLYIVLESMRAAYLTGNPIQADRLSPQRFLRIGTQC